MKNLQRFSSSRKRKLSSWSRIVKNRFSSLASLSLQVSGLAPVERWFWNTTIINIRLKSKSPRAMKPMLCNPSLDILTKKLTRSFKMSSQTLKKILRRIIKHGKVNSFSVLNILKSRFLINGMLSLKCIEIKNNWQKLNGNTKTFKKLTC